MMKRAVAVVLVASQLLIGVPTPVWALPPVAPLAVVVNKTVPQVDPVPLTPQFSTPPTKEEIIRAHVFGEPVLPVGGEPNWSENQAVANALLSFHGGSGPGRYAGIESFLASHPTSPWRASLFLNLGHAYRADGYFTRAMVAFEEAWNAAKSDQTRYGREVADGAVGQFLEMNGRFGRVETLDTVLAELKGRPVMGPATEKITAAAKASEFLTLSHEQAIQSGTTSLWRILTHLKGPHPVPAALSSVHARPEGYSMAEMRTLSATVGLSLTGAYRVSRDAPVPIPSMAHLRAGHFTAVVGANATHYRLDDLILGGEVWVTKDALADDTTGYFLISGPMEAGWRAASTEELDQQIGHCAFWTIVAKPGGPGCTDCEQRGLARYDFLKMTAALHLVDNPVGYDPPRGPSVQFVVDYDQRDDVQPTSFNFSNLGPKWRFDWMSYVQEQDPSVPAGPVKLYSRVGRWEIYDGYDGTSTFKTHRDSQAVMVRTSTSPITYERSLPDGSKEVFAQSNGAASFRRVFLTQSIDPQGQSISYTYDSSMRLVAVTDVIGQVTTLSYGMATDPLKVTKVTDPFGRSAILEYDGSGRLTKITDVIGMSSQFEYGNGDFIRALVTPYGRSTFAGGSATGSLWIEAKDPLGGTERLVFQANVCPSEVPTTESPIPTGFASTHSLNCFTSYYWDKRASALHPGDYNKAEMTQWAWYYHIPGAGGELSAHPLSVKKPLESRVWYSYAGGSLGLDQVGTLAKPSKVGRVLDDGSSQIYRYEYNNKGHKTRETDPLGRETIYTYDANEIDLLNVKQKNGSSYDLLETRVYKQTAGSVCPTGPAHRPCKVTDVAGKFTLYNYNANGTLASVVTPERDGLSEANRTTTYSYVPNGTNGEGRVQTVTAPLSHVTTLAYDSYGRVSTATEPDSYARTFDYDGLDRTTKTTYPDGTFEEVVYNRLNIEKTRDRLGRWRHAFYDSLGRLLSSRDADGGTTTPTWCNCGSLDKITDANGNMTRWEYDVQGRKIKEIRPNASEWLYSYENTTSRLKEITDPKGQVQARQYFLDNKMKQVSYTNATYTTPTVSFTYDAAFGRVATMTDGTGTSTISYNAIGAPPSVGAGQVASVDGPAGSDTITYGYDELGRRVSRTLDSQTTSLGFDALGRTTTVIHPVGTFTYGYSGVTTLSYPNGTSTTWSHLSGTNDRHLQEIHHKFSGGATLSKQSFVYDVIGNITLWTQQDESSAAKAYDFSYDVDDQLVRAVYRTTDATPTILKRYEYVYDPIGNRTAEQVDDAVIQGTFSNMNRLTSRQPGGALSFRGSTNEAASVTVQSKPATTTSGNTFSGAAQVGSGTSTVTVTATDPANNVRTNNYEVSISGGTTSYSYDANGNLTQESDGTDTWTYDWYADNALAKVSKNSVEQARFVYDGDGRRYQKIVGSVTTTYVYDAEDILREATSGGTTYSYVHGPGVDEPLARKDQSGAVVYYYGDHLGSILKTTNGSGAVVTTRRYDPFGNLEAGSTEPGYAFTGREWDPEIGLFYFRTRYYSAIVGRWLSEDPDGIADGPNRYAYVHNNPIHHVDPYGKKTELCCKPVKASLGAADHCFIVITGNPGLNGSSGPPRVYSLFPTGGVFNAKGTPQMYNGGGIGDPSDFDAYKAKTAKCDPKPVAGCDECWIDYNSSNPGPSTNYNLLGPNSNTWAKWMLTGAGCKVPGKPPGNAPGW